MQQYALQSWTKIFGTWLAISVTKKLVWTTMKNFHTYIARKKLLKIHDMYTTKNPL